MGYGKEQSSKPDAEKNDQEMAELLAMMSPMGG